MSEAVMGVGMFQSPDATTTPGEEARPAARLSSVAGWSSEIFAREQIRGLVRKLFFSGAEPPVRQVVFSAVEPETEVRRICRQIGEALARETTGTVAVMGGCPRLLHNAKLEQVSLEESQSASIPPLRRIATRLRTNLWLVPAPGRNPATTASLHSYVGEVRREFDYSIVEAPPVGVSNEATALAQFADGIILVLSAQRTRRIAAGNAKNALEAAQARLLGTVLSDRVFPIPESLYRRL